MQWNSSRTVIVALAAVVVLLLGVIIGSQLGGDEDDGNVGAPPIDGSALPTPAPSITESAPTLEPTPEETPSTDPGTDGADLPAGSVVDIADLSGKRVGTPFTVRVETPGDDVRFYLDGNFLSRDQAPPFELQVTAPPGKHTLETRAKTSGGREEQEVEFEVVGGSGGTGSSPSRPSGPAPDTAAKGVPAAPEATREVTVATTEELRTAIASAAPGDRITMADGTYLSDPQLEASASGTAQSPIQLVGGRGAVITTGEVGRGGYALHVTGSFWRLSGFTVREAKKGIVLDGSIGSILEKLDVGQIGQEAVHFRTGSSGGAIVDSEVHDTGLEDPKYGEGVYVGSAQSNWDKYATEGGVDVIDSVLVQGNFIHDTTAEGIDIKEGTSSGVIRGNRFQDAGTSGDNFADSWVDIKGNGWLIEGNTGSGTLVNAFESHDNAGWGRDNTFRDNNVTGGVPGVVVNIAGKDARGNVVTCDNKGAAGGTSNIDCSG